MDPLQKIGPVMFSKVFVLFGVILLLNQSCDSIDVNNLDSTFLTNISYIHENSRRYIRQTNQQCHIPNNPPHTKYNIIVGQKGTNYAQNNNVLEISCDGEYKQRPFDNNFSICRHGEWDPPLSNCMRTCPSLTSITSTNIHCKWNDPSGDTIPLRNCINPVVGTVVFLSCNAFYEEPYIKKNPVHVCTPEGKWNPAISACYPICGLKRPKAINTIVNGAKATPGDYPWQIGVYNARKQLICGGSILANRVVLSAAHCFTDYDGNLNPIGDYFITSGKYYREYEDSRDNFAQYSRVLNIYIPARYKGIVNLQGFDIAVVILADPFKISLRVQPVCIELNEESQDLHLSSNRKGIVTGWGYTQNSQELLSDVLKEVAIPYVSYDDCYAAVPHNFRRYITHDKICGGYINNGTSVCGGDSGGALVFQKLNSDQHYVKGIVSVSPATEDGFCDTNQYSVYTAVTQHIDFVRNHLLLNQNRQNIECAQQDCSNESPETEQHTTERYTTERYTTRKYTTTQYTTKKPVVVVKKTCTLPNFPPNGRYRVNQNDAYQPGSHVQPNSLLSVTCNTGFELADPSANQVHCTDAGEWSSSPSICTRINTVKKTCTLPNFPPNGRYRVNQNDAYQPGSHVQPNSLLSVTCNTGFELADPSANQVHCTDAGEWSSSPSICTRSLPIHLVQHPLLPTLDECGLQSFPDNEVEGTVQVKEYPWLVLIVQIDQRSSRESTGKGCLISRRYVLTTAFLVARYQYSLSSGLTSVILGMHEYSENHPCRSGSSCPHVVTVGAEAMIVHPDYDTQLRVANIALLRLNRNVAFNEYIRPACLPTTAYTVPTTSNMWLAGWARLDSSNGLQKIKGKLSVRSATECNLQGVDFTRTFCATTSDNFSKRNLCTGDLAGPGFERIANPATNQWHWAQVGITTFSYNSVCGSSHYTGYYTSVSDYTDWIISNLT